MMKMAMIKAIFKTAVTSNTTVSELNKTSLSKIYEELVEQPYLRMDLSPERSTILGTRYLYEQPYKQISIYDRSISRLPCSIFQIFLEPLPYEPLCTSDVYWRKINQNPKNDDWDIDADGQFVLLPKSHFKVGNITIESVDESTDNMIPRHLVCTYT